MTQPKSLVGTTGKISAFCIAVFLAWCAWAANGPDRVLTFEREIPSKTKIEDLASHLSDTRTWTEWFYITDKVEVLSAQDPNQPGTLEKGAQVRFHIDPKKGFYRKFSILTQVTEYIPGKLIEFKVLGDSSGKLLRQFSDLVWRVELLPNPKGEGTLVRGSETAFTRSWQSRLFGQLSRRILMHQVFYPNLVKLAEIKQPVSEFRLLMPDTNPLFQKQPESAPKTSTGS